MRFVVILLALLFSSPAFAQGKFFSTPSRGGADGARQNAQLTTINSEFERMNACTGAGAVYAPTHPDANAGGCVTAIAERSMTGGLAVQGDAAISGQLDVAGTVRIAGEAEPCNGAKAGSLRYNAALEQMEFCNGSDWGSMGGGGSLAVVASGTVTVPGNSYSTAVTGLAAGSQYSAYVEPTYSTPGCGYILPTFGKGSDGKVAMTLWNNASCGGSVKWSVVRLGGSGTSSGGGTSGGVDGVCPSGETLHICRRYYRWSPTYGWSDTGYGCSPIGGAYLVSSIGDDTGWTNQTLEIALRCQ